MADPRAFTKGKLAATAWVSVPHLWPHKVLLRNKTQQASPIRYEEDARERRSREERLTVTKRALNSDQVGTNSEEQF